MIGTVRVVFGVSMGRVASSDGLAERVLMPNLNRSCVDRWRKKGDRGDGQESCEESEARSEDNHGEVCVSSGEGCMRVE